MLKGDQEFTISGMAVPGNFEELQNMLIKASDEWGNLINRYDPKEVTIKI